jgi:hypothetical protein
VWNHWFKGLTFSHARFDIVLRWKKNNHRVFLWRLWCQGQVSMKGWWQYLFLSPLINMFGMLGLFFLRVPVNVRFWVRTYSVSWQLVKKLCVVQNRGDTRSWTTLIPWFCSRGLPCSFPVHTCMLWV